MNQDDELWAYDEPHDSGGNCHVTMTRRQAIDWMRKVYPWQYCGGIPDNKAFFDWMACHWAYREAPPIAPERSIDS